MPLKFTDLPMIAAPVWHGTMVQSANQSIANLIAARQQAEAARYHDMMKAQEDRRMDSVEAGQRALNEERMRRMAFDINKARRDQIEAERDANEKTMLDAQKLALTDPVAAQALLANRGLLAPQPQPQQQPIQQQPTPQPQGAQPQEPIPQEAPKPQFKFSQAAIDAGINPQQIAAAIEPLRQMKTGFEPQQESQPQPEARTQMVAPESQGYSNQQNMGEDYSVMAGGQRFQVSPQQEMAKRVNTTGQLFAKLLDGAPEQNKEVASQVLNMAPEAVRATGGDTMEAAHMLLNLYTKTIPRRDGKKKGSGDGAGGAGLGTKRQYLYLSYLREAESHLKNLGFHKAEQSLQDLGLAYKNIQSNNGTQQWNAIRTMIKAYESGRLSDFDVQSAKGYMSVWQKMDTWFTEHTGGELSPDVRQQIAESIRTSLIQLHRGIQNKVVKPMLSRLDEPVSQEEKLAYQKMTDMAFDKYDWYQTMKPGSKNKNEPSGDGESLAQRMAKKYGQK